jgi:hypothetical protein
LGGIFSVRILCKIFYDKTDAACIVHYHHQLEAAMMKNQSVRRGAAAKEIFAFLYNEVKNGMNSAS